MYLGTTTPPALAAGDVTGTSYTRTGLAGTTTYYWKIVPKNNGVPGSESSTWSFSTAAPPAAVTLLSPGNTATGQAVGTALTWTAASGATSYDVYLGTTNPPSLAASGVTGTSFTPTTALAANSTNFWKVVAKNDGGNTESAVWSFTTASLPGTVTLATPTNGQAGTPISTALTWAAASGATSYDVYLGTASPPSFVANVTGATSYTPTALLTANTAYYWKVVAKNNGGTTESPVWSFSTAAPGTVTITSVPAGLSMSVDDTPCTSPCTFQWAAGSSHKIGTTATQSGTGTQYRFASWSDGGGIVHTITVASTTYTATFTTQYYLATVVDSNIISGSITGTQGTITPGSAWYDPNATVSIAATPTAGYQFIGFSGDLTGTSTPRNVTMNAPKTVNAIFGKTSYTATPTSGPGPTRFSLRVTNPNGASTINSIHLVTNWDTAAAGGCYIEYMTDYNVLGLQVDGGGSWLGLQPPGTPGYTVTNSQCTLDIGASSVTSDGASVTLNVSVTFKPAFKGARNVYAYTTTGTGPSSQNWELLGTYKAYDGQVITFNPANGSVLQPGGTGSTSMQVSDGGAWYAVPSETWLHVTSAASGAGNSTLSYSVDANPTFGNRSGAITANGFGFWVYQAPLPPYVIGGRITDLYSGAGVPGVSVALSGTSTNSTVTDTDGAYWFYVTPGSYTLTSSHPSYTLSAPQTFNNITGNQTANFTATPGTLTISGNVNNGVTGVSGITISLAGTQNGAATTNTSGDYAFTVRYGGNYTLTPPIGGQYTFYPTVKTYTSLSANQTLNFTAAVIPLSITGTVTDGTAALPGVTLELAGNSQRWSTSTDDGGQYSFSFVPMGGNYTLTPTKAGYTFNPTSIPYNNLSASQTGTFTGTRTGVVKISGIITGSAGPLGNMTVELKGDMANSKSTDSSGRYEFSVNQGGHYIITATSAAYEFAPLSYDLPTVSADQNGRDFAGTRLLTIGGKVKLGSSGLSDVALDLSGYRAQSTTTTAAGDYTFRVPEGHDYTVKPSRSGYRFNPDQNTYTALTSDKLAEGFDGIATVTYTITGTITISTTPVAGVSVNLSAPLCQHD